MKYRKGIFAVVYSKDSSGKIEYLLLKRKKHWKGWEFVKGKIEQGESKLKAAKREVSEETGLKILNIKDFGISGKYKYGHILKDRPEVFGQTYHLFGAEVKKGKVSLDSKEHSEFQWFGFEEALDTLTWNDQKRCISIIESEINKKIKFRKIITSSGKLVFAGKDAKNNEKLIEQADKEEIVLHTAKPGSPFVNIKGKAGSNDIKEAAVFCARYSQDWRDNKKDVMVHIFKGKDIYKSKGMKTGTFGIKDKKEIKVKKDEIKKWQS